jgi:hypothetical protein
VSELLNRCGSCKHWERYADKFDVEYHGSHAGRCTSDKFVYSDDPKPLKDGLRYWDYEDYSAGFDTGDEFGCIHWIKR